MLSTRNKIYYPLYSNLFKDENAIDLYHVHMYEYVVRARPSPCLLFHLSSSNLSQYISSLFVIL